MTAAVAYLLNRGEYDQRRDQLSPGTPAALPPMAADLPRNRLALRAGSCSRTIR